MNEFLIELQAKLDEAKSKGLINSDIDKIQGQLNKLKVQAEIDPNTISHLVKQLEGVINQRITISNININQGSVVKEAQKTGQQIGNALSQGIKQTSSLDSVIDKQVKQLMSEYSIVGEKGSNAFEQIKQAILNYKKELSATTSSSNDIFDILGNSANINNVTSTLAENMKVADATKSVYANLLEYIKQVNSSGSKVHLPQSIKAEYGDMFTSMRNSLGAAFTTGKGTDFETFVTELNRQLGNTIDMSHGAEYAFEDLVNKVKSAKGSNYLSGNNLLSSGLVDVTEMESKISSVINNIEAEEKRLAQASITSTDTIIQNEERKQQSLQETAQIQQQMFENKSLIKSGANVTTFDNTNNAAREAAQYFKELLKDENAVLSISERFGKSNGLTSFTVNVKRANGEVESLRYSLENIGTKDDPFYKFKNIGAELNNSGAVKQIQAIENAFSDYTAKLAQFKSTNNNILSGLSAPLSDFESKLNGLKNGTSTINEVKNSFNTLKAEASKVSSNLSGELSKIDKAVRNIAKGEETISGLKAEFKGLSNTPKEINSELNKLSTGLQNIKKLEVEEGRTANWSKAYKEWENAVNSLTAKLQTLKKEQSNSATTQVFNVADLDKQGKIYVQKVSNTIAKTKSELESKLRNVGYTDIEIKGVEDAKGKIKTLTASVTDATGAFKQLNFERAKIQNQGKAQSGFVQTNDVKVIGNISSAINTVQSNLSTLKAKWQDQGILVGEFKTKVEQLESSLVSVGNKGELNNLKSQIQSLKNEATTISQVNKIQFQVETGGYDSKVESLISKTRQWTDEAGNARINTVALSNALNNLTNASNTYSNNKSIANQEALIGAERELDKQVKIVTNSVRTMNAEFAKNSSVSSLHQRIQEFYDKNSASHRKWGTDLNRMLIETANGAKLTHAQLQQLEKDFIGVANAARQSNKLGKSWFQTLKDGMGSFSYWLSSTFLVMKTIQSVKGGLSTVKALDTALVDLKKTTTMTSSELEKFYYDSNKVAKQMGVTTEEIINQASAWSRLGFSSGEAATKMAKYSSMFASISPGMDVDKATNGLVSIMKAFDIGNDNPDDVLDEIMSKVNIIGNTAATSNAEIVNMLTKSSSAMKEANNTLEETIALETAAVEITRDDDSVGTAFKTKCCLYVQKCA